MKKNFFNFNNILTILAIIVIVIIFKTWIFSSIVSAGDFEYYSLQRIKDIQPFGIWDVTRGGLGASILPSLWLESYTTTTIKLASFIGWEFYIRLFWYLPYIIFSFISTLILFKSLFKNNFLSILTGLIYTANTYSLMMVAGGQMGIALSYSLAPFVYYFFIKLLNNLSLKNSVLFGFVFALVSLLDIRIGYMLALAILIYFIFSLKIVFKNIKSSIIYMMVLPLLITLGIHFFWLLPAIFSAKEAILQLGDVYTSSSAVKFFSFATMENAFGFLHPNWPENIFGKVGFMKPEFLILPILAYLSLLFVKNEEKDRKKYIVFFVVLGLVGNFLAKGVNDPFGGAYLWLFENVPGFVMFRDPTKWYSLIAISYSILILFTVFKIYDWLKLHNQFSIFNFQFSTKNKIFNFQNLFLLFLTSYLLFLIRPALLGQLNGTFKTIQIAGEYKTFENYLLAQNNFSRTLWLPKLQRFGFYSNLHPAISAQDLFHSSNISELLDKLKSNKTQQLLINLGVKTVVIPYDAQKEIFTIDRKYNYSLYENTVRELRKITWLKEKNGFGKIKVFEVHPPAGGPKDHFWTNSNTDIEYKQLSSVEYKLIVKNARKNDLIIFAESYDSGWKASSVTDVKYQISSTKFDERLNSFILPKDGNYTLSIYYYPQKYVNIGIVVSIFSLVVILSVVIFGYRYKKW